MLVVVRHAEAEVRVVGGPSEAERPLTARGPAQAEALTCRLLELGRPLVCTSPYRRAFDTVAPAAAVLGTRPASAGDGPVILASHGPWIARGIEALGAAVTRELWRSMPFSAVYELARDGERVSTRGPGLT